MRAAFTSEEGSGTGAAEVFPLQHRGLLPVLLGTTGAVTLLMSSVSMRCNQLRLPLARARAHASKQQKTVSRTMRSLTHCRVSQSRSEAKLRGLLVDLGEPVPSQDAKNKAERARTAA